MSPAEPQASERPICTVAALIQQPDGKLLLLKVPKWSGRWGLPGGKVDRGETLAQGIRREVREETGLELTSASQFLVQELIEEPELVEPKHLVSVNYLCTCAAQEVVLNDEATEHAWVNPDDALAMPLNRPTRAMIERLIDEMPSPETDRILIEDLQIPCIVGILPREREVEQPVLVTAIIETSTRRAAASRRIEDTLDYAGLADEIKTLVQEGRYLLIETMAEEIAALMLADERAYQVHVLVRKPEALAAARFATVSITRARNGKTRDQRHPARPGAPAPN